MIQFTTARLRDFGKAMQCCDMWCICKCQQLTKPCCAGSPNSFFISGRGSPNSLGTNPYHQSHHRALVREVASSACMAKSSRDGLKQSNLLRCSGSDTRDCGDLLVTHAVKDRTALFGACHRTRLEPEAPVVQEDILGNISWIMKNFNSSVHDPRILSYSVEASFLRGTEEAK